MSSALLTIIGLLLAIPLQVSGTRIAYTAKQNSHAQINETARAFHCASLCVKCDDGERTVLVHRSKSLLKTVVDIGLATNAVLNPLPGTTLFTGSMIVLEKAFIHHLGDECPNMEIIHMEHGEVNKIPDDKLASLLSKDDYLGTFKKNLGNIYDKEQKEKGVSGWGNGRQHGTMPDIISSYMDNSELFCGDNGKIALDNGVKEEGTIRAGLSWIPGLGRWTNFGEYCESIANEQ